MEFTRVNDKVEVRLTQEEFRFLYMVVYSAVQFVDDVDFASVTGLYKVEARRFLDEADKQLPD